ncbi:MAG: DUF4190 domain-containing protein [Acidimicrobiales bacterium]
MSDVIEQSRRWPLSVGEDGALSAKAILRITRNPAPWRDRYRSYKVLVDGAEVGTVRNGETTDFGISAGHHEVRIKLDWAGSNLLSLDVGVGEVAHLECEPGGSAITALFDTVVALCTKGRSWIKLRRVSDATSTPSLPSPPCSPSPSPPFAPPPSPSPLPPPYYPDDRRVRERTSGLSIASLVLGILWGFGLASVFALLLGYVAKHRIDRSAGRQGGRAVAVAGIVLGWVGIASVVILAVVGAVIGEKPTRAHTTGTELSIPAAAQAYLGFISPINSASDAFANEAAQWNQTTGSQAESEAQPLVSALRTFRQELLHMAWPSAASRDVTKLAASVTPLVDDLQALTGLSAADVADWRATFTRDVTTVKTNDNAVRRDLDLPLVSSGNGVTGTSVLASPPVTGNPSRQTEPTSPVTGTTNPTSTGNQTGKQGGGGTSGGSCFGCVTVTTVSWGFYAAPDSIFQGEYAKCLPLNTSATWNSQVIGPPGGDPTRDFTAWVKFTPGCTTPDGSFAPDGPYTVGKVELQGEGGPISVVGTDPMAPFDVSPGVQQELVVTFHALDGNYYDGPLSIDVIFD